MNKNDVCLRLSDFVKRIRKSKNLTQDQLADIIGVSTKTISRMEQRNGVKLFNSLESLNSMAELGGVDIHELIDFLLPDLKKLNKSPD